MIKSTCCFTCGYFYGLHVNPLGFICGYCSFVPDSFVFSRCKLIIAPFHYSCENYGNFIGTGPDDIPEYDPSDPFGHIDPGFDIEPYNDDHSLDDSSDLPEHFFWDRD